jgi:glucosamine kinase
MILIADSGSTKCDWQLLDSSGKEILEFNTMGLNPYFHDAPTVTRTLHAASELADKIQLISHVFFYGSGSSSPELCSIIEYGLKAVFANAVIVVDHDLVGAAYSTYQGAPAITCILGTGSNSCFFDGKHVSEVVPALAYILGDEGSGSYFGKQIIRDYFYHRLPKEIEEEFVDTCHLTHGELVQRVYGEDNANVFLSNFTAFLSRFPNHDYVVETLRKGFDEFISIHVKCYENWNTVPVHFVGSIAHHFRSHLETAIEANGLIQGVFVEKPIIGLVNYHNRYVIPKLQQ